MAERRLLWGEEPPVPPPGWTVEWRKSAGYDVPSYHRGDGWSVEAKIDGSDSQIGTTYWPYVRFKGAKVEIGSCVGWGLSAIRVCLDWVDRSIPRQPVNAEHARLADFLWRVWNTRGKPLSSDLATEALVHMTSLQQ